MKFELRPIKDDEMDEVFSIYRLYLYDYIEQVFGWDNEFQGSGLGKSVMTMVHSNADGRNQTVTLSSFKANEKNSEKYLVFTVWGRLSAYNFQKVHWLLEELGIEYKHVNVGGALGGLDTEEFLAMNPNGRIPVVRDGENIIWESNSILRYLASTYGAEKYWSDSPVERSQFERWMDWELSTLQPLFIELFWGYYRTPVEHRDEDKIEYYRQQCEQYINVLNSHLEENEYVSGSEFGLADICVGTCFFRYFNMGLEVGKPVNISVWYSRLSSRPYYQNIIQVPFDELKGRLEF